MKFFIFFFFTLSINVSAAEVPHQFFEEYPQFKSYQEALFAQLKNYFEVLPKKTLTHSTTENSYSYKVLTKDGLIKITSIIERQITPNQICEKVYYAVENKGSFSYAIIKQGPLIAPTKNLDLLTFNFKKNENDIFYQISIPDFGIILSEESNQFGYTNLYKLDFMEFRVATDLTITSSSAVLNYTYFFKLMFLPQVTISVQAFESESQWGEINYLHSITGDGQVTPATFYKALDDGISPFYIASEVLAKSLATSGFPGFD